MIYYTSDLHFGHGNILKYDFRPFTNIDVMNEAIISNWNSTVTNEDTIYVLGDISWYNLEKTTELVKQLKGNKILIKGNHDIFTKDQYYRMGFNAVYDYKEIKDNGRDVILCHYPIPCFNKRFYGAFMLYGHVHNSSEWNYMKDIKRSFEELDTKCNMYNVGTMIWNYYPVTLDEIIKSGDKK